MSTACVGHLQRLCADDDGFRATQESVFAGANARRDLSLAGLATHRGHQCVHSQPVSVGRRTPARV